MIRTRHRVNGRLPVEPAGRGSVGSDGSPGAVFDPHHRVRCARHGAAQRRARRAPARRGRRLARLAGEQHRRLALDPRPGPARPSRASARPWSWSSNTAASPSSARRARPGTQRPAAAVAHRRAGLGDGDARRRLHRAPRPRRCPLLERLLRRRRRRRRGGAPRLGPPLVPRSRDGAGVRPPASTCTRRRSRCAREPACW